MSEGNETNSTADWSKAPLHIFTERKKTDLKKLPKRVRKYYVKQNEWIETLEQLDQMYRDEAHVFVVHDGREQKSARNRQEAEEACAKPDDLAQSDDHATTSNGSAVACEASSPQQSTTNAEGNEEDGNGLTKRIIEKDESAVEVALLPGGKPGDAKTQKYTLTLSDYDKKVKAEQRTVALIAKGTLLINILLLIMKIVASALSGSLSVVSSVVDSAVDLASGVVMWLTTRAVRRRNVYAYPNGRTRLEPLGILILSVIMGLACVQVIIESVESIVQMAQTGEPRCRTTLVEVGILCGVIVTKAGMWVGCYIINRRFSRSSETLTALAQDHRNDVLTNSVAIVGAYVGALGSWMRFFDPVVAAAISTYVLVSWLRTGYRHIRRLSG